MALVLKGETHKIIRSESRNACIFGLLLVGFYGLTWMLLFSLVKWKSSNFRLLAHSNSMFQGLELQDWMNSHSMEIKCNFLPTKHHVGKDGFLYTMCFLLQICFLHYSLFILRLVIQVSKRYSNWFLAMCVLLGIVADDYLDLEQSFRFNVRRKHTCFKRNTAERAKGFHTFYNVSFVLMKSM